MARVGFVGVEDVMEDDVEASAVAATAFMVPATRVNQYQHAKLVVVFSDKMQCACGGWAAELSMGLFSFDS